MKELALTKFRNSPSFTFRAKFSHLSQQKNVAILPSPCKYSPEKPMNGQVKVGFPKSKRRTFVDREADECPGPGQYESGNLSGRSMISAKSDGKFQTCSSRFEYKKEAFPGPGTYQIKSDLKKTTPSFSIRNKTRTFHEEQIQRNSFKQDPGAYNIDNKLFRDSSVISIPRSERSKSNVTESPGPGRYDTAFQSQRSFGRRSFSTSKRNIDFKIKNTSPGPAGYSVESSFDSDRRKQRGFSCRIKIDRSEEKKSSEVPGPGEYGTQSIIKFRSPVGCRIPQAERKIQANFIAQNKYTPGPGRYENLTKTYEKLNYKSQSAAKFSKAKLQSLTLSIDKGKTDNFYEFRINTIRKSSSSFTIGSGRRSKLFEPRDEQKPGPGDYNPEDTAVRENNQAPRFPKAQRPTALLNKLKVGPGQYYDSSKATGLQKTGVKFSKDKRVTDFSQLENQNKAVLKLISALSSQSRQLKGRKI